MQAREPFLKPVAEVVPISGDAKDYTQLTERLRANLIGNPMHKMQLVIYDEKKPENQLVFLVNDVCGIFRILPYSRNLFFIIYNSPEGPFIVHATIESPSDSPLQIRLEWRAVSFPTMPKEGFVMSVFCNVHEPYIALEIGGGDKRHLYFYNISSFKFTECSGAINSGIAMISPCALVGHQWDERQSFHDLVSFNVSSKSILNRVKGASRFISYGHYAATLSHGCDKANLWCTKGKKWVHLLEIKNIPVGLDTRFKFSKGCFYYPSARDGEIAVNLATLSAVPVKVCEAKGEEQGLKLEDDIEVGSNCLDRVMPAVANAILGRRETPDHWIVLMLFGVGVLDKFSYDIVKLVADFFGYYDNFRIFDSVSVTVRDSIWQLLESLDYDLSKPQSAKQIQAIVHFALLSFGKTPSECRAILIEQYGKLPKAIEEIISQVENPVAVPARLSTWALTYSKAILFQTVSEKGKQQQKTTTSALKF